MQRIHTYLSNALTAISYREEILRSCLDSVNAYCASLHTVGRDLSTTTFPLFHYPSCPGDQRPRTLVQGRYAIFVAMALDN